MGAYLSHPVTTKISSDEVGGHLKCGASSMQGWRIDQEDAHNCCLNFDKDISLFAVYDGHGGHEVAEYAAENLPDFLKNCCSFEKGDYVEALKEAFLGFDATLNTADVKTILKYKAEKKKSADPDRISDEEEEDFKTLCEEAKMPLADVIAKYEKDLGAHVKSLKEDGPSSSGCHSFSKAGTSGIVGGAGDSAGASIAAADTSESRLIKSESSCELNSSDGNIPNNVSEPLVNSKSDTKEDSHLCNDSPNSQNKSLVNGKVTENSDSNRQESTSEETKSDISDIPYKNGEVKENTENSEVEILSKKKTDKALLSRMRKVTSLYNSLRFGLIHTNNDQEDSDDDDDDDDDEDMTYVGSKFNSTSSDEEEEEEENDSGCEDSEVDDGNEGGNCDGEDEDSDVDEEEEDSSDGDEVQGWTFTGNEEPGADSGCTAVVALLKGRELYVANAGDSRCVVCRNGVAIDMSIDHKPEDEEEKKRIEKAGGAVNFAGRVNGGLNLSRALGDHSYKQTKDIPLQDQMISPLPDVKTLHIEPEDQFMVLACDGIWNSMNSQQVVDFVLKQLKLGKTKISEICEKLFDNCIASNTSGDGTGCDNMTAVIVEFLPDKSLPSPLKHSVLQNSEEKVSLKRSASPISSSEATPAKFSKEEDGV